MRFIARGALLMMLSMLVACGENEQAEAPADERPVVTLATAGEITLAVQGRAPAEVRSANESELSSDVSARVERVHADVGSTVSAGGLILELDATDYRLALAQAEARVAAAEAGRNLARRRLDRARALLDRQFVSEDEVMALETEFDAASAELQVTQADRRVVARNVEKTRIVAPFDGVVVERFAQVGTLAAAGSPLLRFVELAGVEVQATLQVEEAGDVARATRLEFESGGRRHPLRLLRLAPVVDRAGRTQAARLEFDGEPAPAGSTGTLLWTAPGQRLPPELLVRRGQALGFFVAEQGQARFVPVAGAQEGRAFAVEVPADAQLVVRGQQGLNDGQPIRDRAGDPAPSSDAEDAEGAP